MSISTRSATRPEFFESLETRLLLTTWFVDDSAVAGGTGTAASPFQTIQAGIDASVNGDTVNVADGQYTGSLTISKQISLVSQNGSTTTILDVGPGAGIAVSANGVSIGRTGRGFTIRSSVAGTTSIIELGNLLNNVRVEGNVISSVGSATAGVSATGATTGLQISGNGFTIDGGDAAVTFNPATTDAYATNAAIRNNMVTASSGIGTAILLGNLNNMTITGNTLGAPIVVAIGGGGLNSTGLSIVGNTFPAGIDDANDIGISFEREGTGQLAKTTITDNSFANRNVGIQFVGSDVGGTGLTPTSMSFGLLTIQDNNFTGSPGAILVSGATLDNTVTTNARNNFWGSASGPIIDTNTFTNGNGGARGGIVVNNGSTATVLYTPWLSTFTGQVGNFTGNTLSPITNFTQKTVFASLQAAIDAANPGDQIIVNTGTFTENISLTKALRLEAGKNQTPVIQAAAAGPVVAISFVGTDGDGDSDLDDVTERLVVSGFTIEPRAAAVATDFPVQIAAGSAAIHLRNNDIDGTLTSETVSLSGAVSIIDIAGNTIAYGGTGVDFNPPTTPVGGGASDVRIDNNSFVPVAADSVGIDIANATDVVISNNDWTAPPAGGTSYDVTANNVAFLALTGNCFTGAGITANSFGVLLGGEGDGTVVQGNAFRDFNQGLLITQSAVGGLSGLEIGGATDRSGNLFADNGTGIIIFDSGTGTISGVAIDRNRFVDNTTGVQVGISGVPSDDIDASTITFTLNDFFTDNTVALANFETGAADTIVPGTNYWGDFTGPTNPTNPGGTGAVVTGNVDFTGVAFSETPNNPRPDLVADILDCNAKICADIIPGDVLTIPVQITNVGDGAAVGKGVGVDVYLSTDRTLDAGDMLLGSNKTDLSLPSDRSRTVPVKVTVPEVAVGTYFFIAVIDTDCAINDELQEDNNVDAGNLMFELVNEFGRVGCRSGNTTLTLTDPVTGAPVKFSLSGRGTGTVTTGPDGFDVVMTNVDKTTSVTVKTAAGQTATLNDITVPTTINNFTADTSDLTGTATFRGRVNTLKLGAVENGDLAVSGPISTLQAVTFDNGTIAADSIGTMKITGQAANTRLGTAAISGNLGADVTLANRLNQQVALRSMTVQNDVLGSAMSINGNVGTFTVSRDLNGSSIAANNFNTVRVGSATNSSVFAGVANPVDTNTNGVLDLPTSLSGFTTAPSAINSFTVTGFPNSTGALFTDSNIAARTIGTTNLNQTNFDNAGITFGLAGQNINRVTTLSGSDRFVFSNGAFTPTLPATSNFGVTALTV